MADRIRSRVIVGGVVQGVFFRASTRDMAAGLDVDGWVRNRPDGRVEAVFEGDPEAVRQAVAWMRQGPSRAVVETVETFDEEPLGLVGFRLMS